MAEEQILQRLDSIERYTLLAAKNVLTIDDVVLITGLTKGHIYKLTCSKKIPYYKPNSRLMYFDRAEIEAWMKQNRQNTQTEAEQQAQAYCMKKAGRK